jgi:phage terminase large subunit-like protein
MSNIIKLEGIKRQAAKEGWAHFIRTAADEKALLKDHTFSFEHFDHFRYFIEHRIKLTVGSQWAGKPMELLPWHELACGSLFGWIRPDGLRRFRRGYIEIPKKNTKTTLFAAIGLYMLLGDGEPSAEVYNCANDKSQAAILWKIAASMVQEDEELSNDLTVVPSTKRIVKDLMSYFEAWSSDVSGKDGPNAHCILVDELHEWKGLAAREFWGKIRYAGIARDQPICPLTITTAGDDIYSLCYEQRTAAQYVLNGISEDLTLFALIYGANPEKIAADPDYWKTEECWREANPAYGLILKKEDFEADVAAVENNPPEKANFLRYRLGVWAQSSSPWLKAGVWEKNIGPGFTESDLLGQLCYGGLDLSSVEDFTAWALMFPYLTQVKELNEEGQEVVLTVKKFKLIARIFCPEDTFAQRVSDDKTGSLKTWYDKGFIELTPGDSIDHDHIYKKIESDEKKFKLKQIAYDRNSAAWIIQEIQKKVPHVELYPFNQSMKGMSGPTKAFTASLLRARIEHNNNPVLGWMAASAVPESQNAQENLMLHKGKSKDKIDGIIASIMAYNQAELGSLQLDKKFSPYSNEGFKVIKKLENIREKEDKDKKGD